jgi:hypothetical protein
MEHRAGHCVRAHESTRAQLSSQFLASLSHPVNRIGASDEQSGHRRSSGAIIGQSAHVRYVSTGVPVIYTCSGIPIEFVNYILALFTMSIVYPCVFWRTSKAFAGVFAVHLGTGWVD